MQLSSLTLAIAIGALLPLRSSAQESVEKPLHTFLSDKEKSKQSSAYQWLNIAQEATAREVDRNGPRPTIISRTLAIWATAVFDAWAAYDEKAVGSRLGASLRRPAAEHTLENKQKAIACASYHSLLYVYGTDKAYLDGEMRKMGYDQSISRDPTTPEGVGLLAAQAVIDYRKM